MTFRMTQEDSTARQRDWPLWIGSLPWLWSGWSCWQCCLTHDSKWEEYGWQPWTYSSYNFIASFTFAALATISSTLMDWHRRATRSGMEPENCFRELSLVAFSRNLLEDTPNTTRENQTTWMFRSGLLVSPTHTNHKASRSFSAVDTIGMVFSMSQWV